MTYELAQKLKDAGFPLFKGHEYAYLPTLTELIEACGEEFGTLELCSCMPAPHDHACIWDARPKDDRIAGEYVDKWTGRGDTPEEAVANLWLALNSR